ncbi:MAG: glycosyl hydrolase [Pseudomonadota bacterium]
MRWLSSGIVLALAMACAQGAPVVYSPYQFLPLAGAARAGGPGALTWAFATGECGDEKWGEKSGQEIADANVGAFVRAGTDYLISTGGGGGVFTCASDAGMERFIARYASRRLIGLDFDIEAGQTPQQVDALVKRIVAAKRRHPRLRISFTVATHAASDGSLQSLNALGETILDSVRRNGLRDAVFNLMVMDFGAGEARYCVVRDGVCDMAASAVQAVRNVHAKHKIALAQIELTAMIGVNDVVSNVFTLDDARAVARAVRSMKLAGLHFWSLDRDRPCKTPTIGADPSCSTLDAGSGAFERALGRASR